MSGYGIFPSKEAHDEWFARMADAKRPLSILAAEAERKRLETVAADAHRIASALGIEVPEEIKKAIGVALSTVPMLRVAPIPAETKRQVLEVADVIDVLARLIGVR